MRGMRRVLDSNLVEFTCAIAQVALQVLFVVIFHEASLFDGMMCVQEAEGAVWCFMTWRVAHPEATR